MTRPDHGDDQLPELSPDLWEPLSDDVFSRMLNDAMDPLTAPMDLSDVPDQAEEYPEDYVFDGDAAADDAGFGGELDDPNGPDDLDDLDDPDDLGGILADGDDAGPGGEAEDDTDADDAVGGDAL